MDVLKFKRGMFNDLPKQLEIGEPAFCYDTGNLFIGDDMGKPVLLASPKSLLDGGTFNITDDMLEEYDIIMDGGDF